MELTGTVVLPLASPEDARTTAEAAAEYLGTAEHVVLVHVVEKVEGMPDRAPAEEREEYAEEIFATAEEALSGTGVSIETDLLFSKNVPDAVLDLADDVGASSVALVPRETNRLLSLLVGDKVRAFVEHNDVPVVCLPHS
ncbi:MAG: universal stress protein [Halobacteriales archaeon]|nr:universal stress protein [Halobacteriales archaeon]